MFSGTFGTILAERRKRIVLCFFPRNGRFDKRAVDRGRVSIFETCNIIYTQCVTNTPYGRNIHEIRRFKNAVFSIIALILAPGGCMFVSSFERSYEEFICME